MNFAINRLNMDGDQILIKFQKSRRQSETQKMSEILEEVNDDVEPLTEDEANDLRINPPKEPPFPILMMGAGIIKDILDIFSAGFLGWLFAIILGFIVWIWLFTKSTIVRKRLIRRQTLPAVLAFIAAIIPWLNFIPESSVYIYLVYKSEKEIVNRILEKLKKIIGGA